MGELHQLWHLSCLAAGSLQGRSPLRTRKCNRARMPQGQVLTNPGPGAPLGRLFSAFACFYDAMKVCF